MNNKRGQITFLAIIAIAVAILIVVLGLSLGFAVLFSSKWLFYLIGAGLIVLTITNGLKGEYNSEKGRFMIFLVVIGVAFIAIAYTGVLQTAFGGTPEVYYPQYGNMKCSLASSDYNLFEKTGLTTPITIKCGDNMNAYTDFCRFQITGKGSNWLSLAPAMHIQKCNNAGNCLDISGRQYTNDYVDIYSINLDANRDGYLDSLDGDIYSIIKITPSSGWFSSTTYSVRVLGNAYYLEDTQGNNYRTTYEQGCNLNDIPASYHETAIPTKLNYQDSSSQVPFGRSINYVWGMTKGITSNVIYKDGKWIYIQNAGSYSPILTTPDGYSYVDWHTTTPDASIQCVPSNIYTCNANATIRTNPSTNVSGQDCSLIRGVNPNDYLKASTGQCCKFSCVNNQQVASDCKTCAVCVAGQIYNAQTNTCVNPTDTGNTNNPNSANLQCTWYQEQKHSTELNYAWYNYLGIGSPTPVTVDSCVTSPTIAFGVVIVILAIILTLMFRFPAKKKKGSK